MCVLNESFLYIQIKYALETPHQLEGEDAQSVGGCASSFSPPLCSNLRRTLRPCLATDRGPNKKTDISADLHNIKIIKKECRLKGKWL